MHLRLVRTFAKGWGVSNLQVIEELEKIRRSCAKLRLGTRQSKWFGQGMLGVESLLSGLIRAVEHVHRITK